MADAVLKPMEVAIAAALAAGHALMQAYGQAHEVRAKESWRDLVSGADLAAEACAIEVVLGHQPHARIVSEERGDLGQAQTDAHWVIDALDGSVNYLHQLPWFAVSIAFVQQGQVQAASIYAPLSKDLYYASRGQGAFKNDRRLRVADLPSAQSLFAATFSGQTLESARRPQEYLAFGQVNDASRGCLRTGSAALNLAYLAEGKLNGCWGKASRHWDVMAGLLLAQEAGACTEVLAHDEAGRCSFIAAPPANFQFLSQHVRGCF